MRAKQRTKIYDTVKECIVVWIHCKVKEARREGRSLRRRAAADIVVVNFF